MPRGKKAISTGFTPTTFIRCELSAEDKTHLVSWTAKPPVPLDDLLVEVLQSGHKVSYSFNGTNDSYICSVTGKQEDCINPSMCYTSHAKDPIKALWVAMYKFHVIWQKGVWENASDDEDFG